MVDSTRRDVSSVGISMMNDERLVALCQEFGSESARNELISRCTAWMFTIVGRRAAVRGFKTQDLEDAQQEAVFWCIEAIGAFDTSQFSLHGCRFRTFLCHVIDARFKDFLKRRRRQDRYKSDLVELAYNSMEGQRCLETTSDNFYSANCISEPEGHAVGQELLSRLRATLQQQTSADKELGELLSAGFPLRTIASRLNISYEVAKRRRRKLLVHLRFCLGNRQHQDSS